MNPIEPDEILVSENVDIIDPNELAREIQKLVQSGKLQLSAETGKALPVFALGVAGGLLGSSLLRGLPGLVAGAGLAWWAWSKLK